MKHLYTPKQWAKILIPLLAIVLILGAGGGLNSVWAQSPEGPDGEIAPTAEPNENEMVIDPPDMETLGDAIKDEASVAADDREDEEDQPIDIFDLTFVASRYGSDNLAADVNGDGVIDIFDLAILASNYGQLGDKSAAPEPSAEVSVNGEDFGEFDLAVEAESFDAEAQSYVQYRPLRIGVGMNYFKVYDSTDSSSAPDPYASMSVGGVSARTPTKYNTYQGWPYWRLGWWRYSYFPWAPSYTSQARYYSLPVNVQLRDDDGYVCYGYYGCRYQYQYIDVSPPRYSFTKNLRLYPSACMVVDEAGTRTYGSWLNSNQCRVYLQSWGTEWPRGYISYYIDARWN